MVNSFLNDHFPDIVDLGFTARVEEEFDEIAEGKIAWEEVLKQFYSGFKKVLMKKKRALKEVIMHKFEKLELTPNRENLLVPE